MGFNSVFRVLQEVFPQVAEHDVRLLRAVAVEHSKDADAAVEAVLLEVIPFLSERSTGSTLSNERTAVLDPLEDSHTPARTDGTLLQNSSTFNETLNGNFCEEYSGDAQEHRNEGNEDLISFENGDWGHSDVGPDASLPLTSITEKAGSNAIHNDDVVQGDTESEGVTSLLKCQESNIQINSNEDLLTPPIPDHVDGAASGSMSTCVHANCENFDWSTGLGVDVTFCAESNQRQLSLDVESLEEKIPVCFVPSIGQEYVLNTPESSHQLVVPHALSAESNKLDYNCPNDDTQKEGSSTAEMVDLECNTALNTVVTLSGQICSIDFIEDMIERAKSNKKTMFSVMDSVIGLMREVEAREKAVEEAKEEAAKGGLDILSRVEDLKQVLGHAKDANDMHAGEIYGEKAILATEMRELQSRLLSLSDERDKSLAILDEMREALEERLTVAEKEGQAAEQEKNEKENSAREALAQQELIMEKVVQESQILKQEAEENAKLREFLMDRGHVVDMLQGEISVICQDVKLLKEKFDDRVPLSKSFSSCQTSCILASSSSSLKSLVPEQVLDIADSNGTLKDAISKSSVDDQVPSGVDKTADDHKALADDGWEVFDNREFDM